jgi:hypothetical protein
MARCGFYRRHFKNEQAVRAHLKWCDAYHARDAAAPTPASIGREPKGGRRQAQPPETLQVATPLRPLGPPASPVRAGQTPGRAKADPLEAARHSLQRLIALKRQEVIRRAQEEAVTRYWSPAHPIPPELKIKAWRAIEVELTPLPLGQFQWAELLTLAEQIRDRIYAPFLRAKEATQRAIERATAPDPAPKGQAIDEPRRLAEKKRELIRHGKAFARDELEDADLTSWERAEILAEVEKALDRSLTGEEFPDEVEDLVEEVLNEELEE